MSGEEEKTSTSRLLMAVTVWQEETESWKPLCTMPTLQNKPLLAAVEHLKYLRTYFRHVGVASENLNATILHVTWWFAALQVNITTRKLYILSHPVPAVGELNCG